MDVAEAVRRRTSIRSFKADPVSKEQVFALLEKASRAPSGGNLQPWRVYALAGAPLEELRARAAANPSGEPPEYQVYPSSLWDPYRRRRFECGEDLYATIGIPREDRAGRLSQLARNALLFGAPAGLFFCIDRRLGPPQWADLGIFMQTVMLLAVEEGLSTCAQEFWSRYPQTLRSCWAFRRKRWCSAEWRWATQTNTRSTRSEHGGTLPLTGSSRKVSTDIFTARPASVSNRAASLATVDVCCPVRRDFGMASGTGLTSAADRIAAPAAMTELPMARLSSILGMGSTMISRRLFVSGLTASSIVVGGRPARSGSIETLTLGFQKTGIPLVARQLKIFERRFEKKGIAVNWVEFTSGLNLLQAMDTGNVSFGNAGNVGCIFVQASGGQIVYLAGQPSGPKSEGVLVKSNSPIQSIADLKGKKVGYAKGSSSHNLIAAALEQNGLSIGDITSVNLSAADAALAFENGSIDAWVVWDPYFALGQARSETRVLAYSGDVLPDNASFLLANSTFANSHPELIRDLIEGSAEAGAWAKAHLDEVTAALSQATGINPKVLAEVNARANFDVVPLSEAILSQQQKTADRLTRLGVVPKQISVRDIVWRPPA